MTDDQKPPSGFAKWWNRLPRNTKIGLGAGVVIVVVIVIGSAAGSSKSPSSAGASTPTTAATTTPTTGAPKYQASFQSGGIEVTDASDVGVYITVKNVGDAPGMPDCTVSLSSASGAYTGAGGGDATKAIPPGGQASYMFAVSINNNGAADISQAASTVSCF